jgi:hypothetical protein
MDLELVVNLPQMVADHAVANVEHAGNLFRVQTTGYMVQDFGLGRRQRFEFLPRLTGAVGLIRLGE